MSEERNLRVCSRCLAAIESKEGPQVVIKRPVEEPDDVCEWCRCEGFDVLYEFI